MLNVIWAVREGQALFGPAITARITSFFRSVTGRLDAARLAFSDLTEPGHEVRDLIAQG